MWTFVGILILVTFSMGFEVFLIATSKHERYARLSLLEGVMNLVLCLLLVGPLGSFGVALATLVSHACATGWYVPVSVSRTLGISARRIWREVLRALVLPTLGALGGASLCLRWVPVEGWGSWVVSAAAPIVGFALLYAAFGVNAWEREHLRRALAALRRRRGRSGPG
jgi:O-antigen/teichoic acid export membrane protein